MATKTVDDIVLEGIDKYGADGLVNPDMECGCSKDDLAPCGYPEGGCYLARKEKAPEDSDFYPGDWFVALVVKDGDQ